MQNRSKPVKHSGTNLEPADEIAPSHDETGDHLPWGMPGAYGALPWRSGHLRAGFTTLTVNSDSEAVAAWLAEKASTSTHTATAYRREAERVMLWASLEKGKALSELSRDDMLHFERFLQDPQPSHRWLMHARYPRTSAQWRPFLAPLSQSSRRQSLKIIFSLMGYLVATGWFRANPMPAPTTKGQSFRPIRRSLSPDQWTAIWQKVTDASPRSRREALLYARDRWMMAFFHQLGPRIAEACSARMGDFTPAGAYEGWEWSLIRKGGRHYQLPLPDDLIQELWRFREALGLAPYPAPNESTPVIPSFARMRRSGEIDPETLAPLSANQCYRCVVSVFRRSADVIETSDPHGAHQLRQASTHWLRHTALRELADATNDMRLVQMLAGHANIATSSIYTQRESKELKAGLAKRAGTQHSG